MKLAFNKLLVASVVFTVLSFGLLLASLFTTTATTPSEWTILLPEFRFPVNKKQTTEQFLVEKIVHEHEEGEDVRSALYLTHHGYFMNAIANMKVTYRQKSYTVNDVCFKPHSAIFENVPAPENIDKLPAYFQRLLLEMQRLSPCLIVTPLNCFYDSYHIHSEISNWNASTDYLNRRLRNSYLEAIEEKDSRPYVKSTYGPELIKEWARHMFAIPSKPLSNFSKSDLYSRVKTWLSSIAARKKICADPMRSCDETLDAENYFNVCTVMQQINDYDERRKQRLKFQLEYGDEEFTTRLDCVEDREKFIEWMQERNLRDMLKLFASSVEIPDHKEIPNQVCDGIYHDLDTSSGLELFRGARSFSNNTSAYDTINVELGFMTPENLLTTMRHSDFVNGFESIWTIERARELLNEFRLALKVEVTKFSESRSSRRVKVTTRIVNQIEEEGSDEEMEYHMIYFILGACALMVALFAAFAFSEAFLTSLSMFLLRGFITGLLFIFLCKSGGLILIDSNFLCYITMHLAFNLVMTARVTFICYRIGGCVQSEKDFVKSNFSSLGSVDSLKEDSCKRHVQYVLAKYTKFQVAQDAYSEEPFEKLPKYWFLIAIVLVPVIGVYWFFIDSDVQKICIVLLPAFLIAAFEEMRVKNQLLRERRIKKAIQRLQKEENTRIMSRGEIDNLLSGNAELSGEKSHYESKQGVLHHGSAGGLFELSRSTYDVSLIMAYPNQMIRNLRLCALGAYFRLFKMKYCAVVVSSVAALLILLSIGLLFIPVQRSSVPKELQQDELSIDFAIPNVSSSSWESINEYLEEFNSEIDSITNLQTITNWKKSFDRYERRIYQNSTSKINNFLKWVDDEPISWYLTAPLTRPYRKTHLPNPFRFQFRYGFDSIQKSTIIDVVERIDTLLTKYTETLSFPKAIGFLYEHYHQKAVVWNSFAYHEIFAAAVLAGFFSIIVVFFSIGPVVLPTLAFAFFVVGNRLEIAAIVSLFSLEYHQCYTNVAVFVGFLAAWTPFCDLARFRGRLLYKDQTRRTPELATQRRIRVPHVAAVDTVQIFAIFLTATILLIVITAIIPQFRAFFIPTVILLITLLLAVFNSLAVSLAAYQMFEHEVRHCYHDQLQSLTTTGKVCDMTRKKLLPREEDLSIPMEEFSIRPTENTKHYAPRPIDNSDPPEQAADEEVVNQDPSMEAARRQYVEFTHRTTGMPIELINQFVDNFPVFNVPANFLPNYFALGGAPLDANNGVLLRQPGIAPPPRPNREEDEEERFGLGGGEDDDSYPSSGDDIGDPAKEQQEVTDDVATRYKEEEVRKKVQPAVPNYDDPNVPGPSNPVPRQVEQVSREAPEDSPNREPRILVYQRPPRLHEIPQISHGRNPLHDPPSMEEYVQKYDDPNQPPSRRADQYPPSFTPAMVGYCEDVYWKYNERNLPDNVPMPPRPRDWDQRRLVELPPPEDFDEVPPPGRSAIPIPPGAIRLRERRREQHLREQEARRNRPESPDDTPGL
ncbi:hypothetical protein L3Y34_017652 [Caenorhabditis briggsae]|uniref:Uncharacterized protein n=1 Tax=Caenorhabditis briggsae TaxID=6238 RepID=A0AAE9IU41_CAEBR|nr:hypothetical protein L3Y34_017652 [Caenorhabditis briggsae]